MPHNPPTITTSLAVGNTPVHDRAADDFQPRAQLRNLFSDGNIKCSDNHKIEAFAKKYIVKPDLVKEYLEYLTNIEVRKNVRQEEMFQAKKDKKQKATMIGMSCTKQEN